MRDAVGHLSDYWAAGTVGPFAASPRAGGDPPLPPRPPDAPIRPADAGGPGRPHEKSAPGGDLPGEVCSGGPPPQLARPVTGEAHSGSLHGKLPTRAVCAVRGILRAGRPVAEREPMFSAEKERVPVGRRINNNIPD